MMTLGSGGKSGSTLEVRFPVGEAGEVSGVLSVPAEPIKTGLILAHGAGNDMHQPMLVFLADHLAQAGYLTLRFNFLYKQEGRTAPDRPEKLYQAWKAAHHFLREHPRCPPAPIIAAGKSMGGRIVSQMVAEGQLEAGRLIFLGYPLHPPGRKERLRDRHLSAIRIPMHFFAGTRDPLCDLELLRKVLSHLDAPWQLEVIEGADHSFKVPKTAGISPDEIYQRITEKILQQLAGQ